MARAPLPPDLLAGLAALEASYLAETDPIRQSGFGGGARRWRLEREPVLEAVEGDGDFLDAGCANGYLLECLVRWARARGVVLTPHGLDQDPGLVALARARLPRHAGNLHVANAWDFAPPRPYRYVYTLDDVVPASFLAEHLRRIHREWLERGGRMIVGSYGSSSRRRAPGDVAAFLRELGFRVAGAAAGGTPPVTSFA